MNRRSLTAGSVVQQTSRFITAPVQVDAGQLVLIFVASAPTGFGVAPAKPQIASQGVVWVEQDSTVIDGAVQRRLSCFRSLTTTAVPAGEITISFGDQLQHYCAWSVFEYDGVDSSGVAGANAVLRSGSFGTIGPQGSISELFDSPDDPDGALLVGAVNVAVVNEAGRQITAGANCTEIHEQRPAQTPFGVGATLQTQDAVLTTTAMAWSWSGTAPAAALVVAVKPKPAAVNPPGSGPGPATSTATRDLIKRFEPILHFASGEPYYPVDAKRFVENSALWRAAPPYDNKATWGTPGAAPAPMVVAGQLAAEPGVAGLYLDHPNLRPTGPTDERWLELGGWKNPSEGAEPFVAGGTTNRYANRAALVSRYDTDLKPSEFWYHAEFFDSARLSLLASRVPDFPLGKVVAQLGNPAMLCYYFFFPAHEQSVGGETCPNIEAKESSSHAGDWQCFTILLEQGNTPTEFTPQFFGCTGLYGPDDTGVQFDAEGRTRIIAEMWNTDEATPSVTNDHAHLYVASGTHSLYTSPGTRPVTPYPQQYRTPQHCGRLDTPSFLFPDNTAERNRDNILQFLASLALGTLLRLTLVGFAIGILLADEGDDGPTTYPDDPSNPESAPGDGVVAKPTDVVLPRIPPDRQQSWNVKQYTEGERHYDFVVDRATQGIWPSDDNTTGFRGRWGQRVTVDGLSRRCGPQFPTYWDMFLRALEAGKVNGKFSF